MKRREREIFLDVKNGEGKNPLFLISLVNSVCQMSFPPVLVATLHRLINSIAKMLNENGSRMWK